MSKFETNSIQDNTNFVQVQKHSNAIQIKIQKVVSSHFVHKYIYIYKRKYVHTNQTSTSLIFINNNL
jgi:hypothetical protein